MEWRTEHFKLKQQLRRLGLQIREATGDGNCLFRAVSDQIYGTEDNHAVLRAEVIQFLRENREDFEPFIEDDEPFEQYLIRMSKDGVWGGNMELQVLSLLLEVNISIHLIGSVWEIKNFSESTKAIHLSYHLGEHYNSVRLASDQSNSPAQSIPLVLRQEIPEEILQAEDRREMMDYLSSLIPGTQEHKLQMVISHMFGTEIPSIDIINDQCGAIANAYYQLSDDDPKKQPEEHKETPKNSQKHPKKQDPKHETRPAVLPRNNEKCWCGSNKKYKVCCKAADMFREPEEPVTEAEAGISSLRI